MAARKPVSKRRPDSRGTVRDTERVEIVENPGAGVKVQIDEMLTPDAADRFALTVLAASAEARLANRIAELEREAKKNP